MGVPRSRLAFRQAYAPGVVLLALSAGLGLGFLVSCSNHPQPDSDAQLRTRAAQATATAKQQSKEALQDARVAAAKAERKVNDIAAGVKEGMKSGQPANGARVDINSASDLQLASLPGISHAKARQIEKHRPYRSPHQLVTRGLLTESEFAAISSKVTAQ